MGHIYRGPFKRKYSYYDSNTLGLGESKFKDVFIRLSFLSFDKMSLYIKLASTRVIVLLFDFRIILGIE